MHIRKLTPPDRGAVVALIQSDGTFQPDEVAVAIELIDHAIANPGGDYRALVCDDGDVLGPVVGYVCYGPTPMTQGTWDLYWIATHSAARGRGVATRLVDAMEGELSGQGGRIVRIETSQQDAYGSARRFYARLGYVEVGRIVDFYRQGDDLITLAKRLDLAAQAGRAREPAVSRA